jgi:hypothetical protein
MTDKTAPPDARVDAPWHLWVVGTLSLLFTAFGAYDYVMSQSGNRAYMEGMGVDADAMLAYIASFPLWADAVWAIGVWAGVAGAVLLLLRRKLAYPVWLASMAGLVLSNAYGLAHPIPGMTDTGMTYGTVAVVFVVMLLLTLYARAQRDSGVLG